MTVGLNYEMPNNTHTHTHTHTHTYKAWSLFAVARFYLLGLVEQVIIELLLAHVPHGVQVLKEALQNRNKRKTECHHYTQTHHTSLHITTYN